MDLGQNVDPSENPTQKFGCNSNIIKEDNGTQWYNCKGLDYGDRYEHSSDTVFSFETDHAALRGNADYHSLIKTLAILHAQRIKTVQDIERLEKLRLKVKNNPWEFLNKLKNGDTSDVPSRIEVKQVPKIDWAKYNIKVCGGVPSHTNSEFNSNNKLNQHERQKKVKNRNHFEENSNDMIVRGRVFDQSKPQTFNQLWTAGEQLRLEELLLEFPPEKKENNRWKKIAQALGNRTTKQVCSRVQKYFKKLRKAGLPIPGHQLKTNNMTSIKKKPRGLRGIKRQSNSTFFPTQHFGALQQLDGCEEEESTSSMPVLTDDLKADILRKVIEYKIKDSQHETFIHPGIKCAVCEEMPLKGTRWHCLVCEHVNLCSDCVVSQLSAEQSLHSPCHPLEPLSNPTVAHWDPDYMTDSFQSTNYLDPNFMTASVL